MAIVVTVRARYGDFTFTRAMLAGGVWRRSRVRLSAITVIVIPRLRNSQLSVLELASLQGIPNVGASK